MSVESGNRHLENVFLESSMTQLTGADLSATSICPRHRVATPCFMSLS